jgi:pyruvate ferredoxin oxidoreductase alpha subunit
MQAMDLIPEVASDFSAAFGRESGGLLRTYRAEDAETIVVALGSVLGTIEEAVDELRDQGVRIGALSLKSFRPFPLEEVRAALEGAERVVVLEKNLAVGIGGVVSANVRTALSGVQLKGYTVIAGLGGRSITKESLLRLFEAAGRDELKPLSFLDLKMDVVERELARIHERRSSGSHEQNILSDIGVVAAEPH